MGSSETDVKELAVIPKTTPGSRSTVTTVTPVANCPNAFRNSRAVNAVAVILEVFEDTTIHARSSARANLRFWLRVFMTVGRMTAFMPREEIAAACALSAGSITNVPVKSA